MLAVLGAAVFAICARLVWAQLQQSQNEQRVVTGVKYILETGHVIRHKINDDVSRKFFAAFLKEFDPSKVYFEQRDIDEFRSHETTLDDEVARGDTSFSNLVLARFKERVKDRLDLVDEFLGVEHDFAADESLSTDYEKIDFVAGQDELRDRWRKKIKYDLLMQRLDKTPAPPDEQKQKIAKRYRSLLKRMDQTDSDELLEMFLNALTTSFDPHTQYMSRSTLEDFNISMRLHLDGIGAKLRSEDGFTFVDEVVQGGAADLDGRLHPKDKIVGVARDGEHIDDVVDMKIKHVVERIRGKAGTPVILRVMPAGKTETVEYKLTRAKIELTEQATRGEIIEIGKKDDGKPFRVGVIELPSFYLDVAEAAAGIDSAKSSTKDVDRQLKLFQSKGIDGVVIDLRNNGGGALSEAIDLTGLFIDRGGVVQVKGHGDSVEVHEDKHSGTAYSGPLMVLTSKMSASASEIFAGAIQDYGRGLVVGDHSTHGKGTVQTVVDLARQMGLGKPGELGALKLTIQQFYRVNGDSTQNRGVIADVQLPSIIDHWDIGESSLPNAMPFDHVNPVRVQPAGVIPSELKEKLQSLSDSRRQSSSEFQKLEGDIKAFDARKATKQLSLNEAKRREEIGRGADDEEAAAELDKPKKRETPVFERTYYNNEVLSIMEDFLRLGDHPRVAKSS